MSDSPASVLFDASGNPVGVVLDGSIYRLQVEAKISEDSSGLATELTAEEIRIWQERLLVALERITDRLDTMLAQLATITDEDDPL